MAKVVVLNTGGTVSMQNSAGGGLRPADEKGEQALLSFLSTISVDLDIDIISWPFVDAAGERIQLQDSADIHEADWTAMAECILSAQLAHPDLDGVLILHGTDTMAYTAGALAFALQAFTKPILLTGAQVPLSTPGSDGVQNIRLSLEVLCAPQSLSGEVMIVFGGLLLRGCRARKYSTHCALGFDTPHVPEIAELFPVKRFIDLQSHKQLLDGLNLTPAFSPKVLHLNLHPGLRADFLKKLIIDSEIEGLVIRVFGSGTAPSRLNLASIIEACVKETAGRFQCAVIVSDVYKGSLDLKRYEAGKSLQSPHIVDGRDMTPEAAMTKLMWALAPQRKAMLHQIMQHSLVGEMCSESSRD